MADISIQFYATTEELADWIAEWGETGEIALAVMTHSPFTVAAAVPREIPSLIGKAAVRWIGMFPAAVPADLRVRSMYDFVGCNDGVLVLEIGRHLDAGLYESWLACRTENPGALAKWRRIGRDLKKRTTSGITAINRQNGVAAFYKSTRFSNGAAELEAAGTPMVPTQGPNGPIIKLGRIPGA
jgi:hypothetical protein